MAPGKNFARAASYSYHVLLSWEKKLLQESECQIIFLILILGFAVGFVNNLAHQRQTVVIYWCHKKVSSFHLSLLWQCTHGFESDTYDMEWWMLQWWVHNCVPSALAQWKRCPHQGRPQNHQPSPSAQCRVPLGFCVTAGEQWSQLYAHPPQTLSQLYAHPPQGRWGEMALPHWPSFDQPSKFFLHQ